MKAPSREFDYIALVLVGVYGGMESQDNSPKSFY